MDNAVDIYEGSLRKSSDLTGIFRGRVEDNKDPLQLGRVKIRVPMVHGLSGEGIPIDYLPWATMCTMSSGYNYGSFVVPEIGEFVFVFFEDGDKYKPVYLGSSFGSNSTVSKEFGPDTTGKWFGVVGENETPEESRTNDFIPDVKIMYKNRKGSKKLWDNRPSTEKILLQDRHKEKIELDVKNLTITIYNEKQYVDTDKEVKQSHIVIQSKGEGNAEIHLCSEGWVTINASDCINVNAGNTINMSAKNINVSGGSSIVGTAPVINLN